MGVLHNYYRYALKLAGIVIFSSIVLCSTARSQVHSGSAGSTKQADSVLVDKDGNRYPVRAFRDGKLWMTVNLQLNIPGSYCYNDSSAYCEKYGRLYNWESAQKGCALLGAGWQLPSKDEWQQLAWLYGTEGKDSIETRKKAFHPLLNTGNSTFNAVLGGGRTPEDSYARADAHGFYWTRTETDSSMAWFANFAKGSQSLYHQKDGEKVRAFAVRCVKSNNDK